MNPEVYDNLSLLAEYDFPIGGAQRMLATIAKRMNKPIHIITSSTSPKMVWYTPTIPEIPKTDIIFSPVVDRYKLQIIPGKKQIKFCHSGTSLENFLDNPTARGIHWLTHRRRAYEFWRDKGFNIDLIEKGYVPYDKSQLELTPTKKDQGVFISRICPSKHPDWAMQSFQSTGIPLYLVGSHELGDYVLLLKANRGTDVLFVAPDEGTEVSLDVRDRILRESKILVHCSSGGMHDYLEYSILDGLIFNCVPLCITPDVGQFSIVEERNFGKVVKSVEEAKMILPELLDNYGFYLQNAQHFMRSFLGNQEELWSRWVSKLEDACLKI